MITIRPFEKKDQLEIPDFVVNIQRGEFNVEVTIDDQPDLLDVEAFFRQGRGEFWVAVDRDAGGRIVGTIGMKTLLETPVEAKAVALRKMFVASQYRGSGFKVAQRLFDTFNLRCAELGVQRVLLGTTSQMKAAHRFYERNGFTRILAANLPPYFLRMPVDDVFYDLKKN